MVTNVLLWWEIAILGEAMYVRQQGTFGKFLYLPLNFAIDLKLLK